MTIRPSASVTLSPRWSSSALATVRHAESRCLVDVEPSRTFVLGEEVPHCRHTVLDRDRLDGESLPLEPRAPFEDRGRDRVRQPPEDAPQCRDELVEPWRPVDRERDLPSTECERLEHPRKPEVVVGVEVRQEDLLELGETDVASQELALRSLAAIEQKPISRLGAQGSR